MAITVDSLMEPSENGAEGSATVTDSYMEQCCPLLHALLSLAVWKGERRKPATLILFAEDGRYKVTVNDRERQRVAFVTLDGCEDFLSAIEAHIRSDGLEWRQAKGQRYQR